jgi:hypothetical protein
LRMASERDHHPVAVVFVGLYVDREKKRKMCADKAIKTARYKSNLSKCSVIGAMYSQEGNTNGAYTQVLSLLYSL